MRTEPETEPAAVIAQYLNRTQRRRPTEPETEPAARSAEKKESLNHDSDDSEVVEPVRNPEARGRSLRDPEADPEAEPVRLRPEPPRRPPVSPDMRSEIADTVKRWQRAGPREITQLRWREFCSSVGNRSFDPRDMAADHLDAFVKRYVGTEARRPRPSAQSSTTTSLRGTPDHWEAIMDPEFDDDKSSRRQSSNDDEFQRWRTKFREAQELRAQEAELEEAREKFKQAREKCAETRQAIAQRRRSPSEGSDNWSPI